MLAFARDDHLERLINNNKFRQVRYIGLELRLPTFDGFKKINFIDTLQTICMKFNILKYNKEKIERSKVLGNVIRALRLNKQSERLSEAYIQITNKKKEELDKRTAMSIINIIDSLPGMSSKIDLFKQLKNNITDSFYRQF